MSRSERNQAVTWLDLPPTVRQARYAICVAGFATVGFAIVAPFAGTPLAGLNALFPSLDAIVFVTDLTTAVLLFAQFSIARSRALFALAIGYLFTAVIVVPHALTFAGAFTPRGLLGANIQTGSWLFIFWHIGFGIALLSYAVLRLEKYERPVSEDVIRSLIGWGAVLVIVAVLGLTWLATAGAGILPPIILDQTRISAIVVYPIWFAILLSAGSIAFLWIRQQRSVLDQWLMVVSLVAIGELAFSGLLPPIRFSAGFYAGRIFSLITSSIVLIVLLAEATVLYLRLAHSNALLRRERDNKLMSLEAVAISISHEIRQPLGAIAMNSEAALVHLARTPHTIGEVKPLLTSVIADAHRASEILRSIRTLFGRADQKDELIDLNELIIGSARTLRPELIETGVTTRMEFASALPALVGNRGQLQEVVINLMHNAIDAMATLKSDSRTLIARTNVEGHMIILELEDSGPGIDPGMTDNLFDPFITTKPKGMGLGLAICQKVVERHKGRISVSASRPHGSIFRVVLPYQQPS
jgi:signal transduction histidine kinase